jgi:hypothetical protein
MRLGIHNWLIERRRDDILQPEEIELSDAHHLPIIKAFADRIDKDHRPDLNQFLISLLCTGGNVPIFSKLEDGNASDKKVNNLVHSRTSPKSFPGWELIRALPFTLPTALLLPKTTCDWPQIRRFL